MGRIDPRKLETFRVVVQARKISAAAKLLHLSQPAVTAQIREGAFELPEFIRSLPWIGDDLQAMVGELTREPEALRAQLTEWVRQGAERLVSLIGDVGRNAAKLGFALITVFFLYRDGESVLEQVQRVLHRFLGARVDDYLAAVGGMTKAVVWGLVATDAPFARAVRT